MKKRFPSFSSLLIRVSFLLLTLLIGLPGCTPFRPTPTPTPFPTVTPTPIPLPPFPLGRYDCISNENGLLVGTGSFTLEQNGTVIDEMTGDRGQWLYQPTTGSFVFSETIEAGEALFHPTTGALVFILREGITRTHVQDGNLVCFRYMD